MMNTPNDRRRALLLALPLCLAAAAGDALGRYGYTAAEAEDATFASISGDEFVWPTISAALRALPPESRTDAVLALGKAVRAYVESKPFKARWAEAVQKNVPAQAPQKGNTAAMVKANRDVLAKQNAQLQNPQLQQALKNMAPEQRAQVEAAMKQALAAQGQMVSDGAAAEQQEAARYKEELAVYNKAKGRWPQDSKLRVRVTLERFLAATADVDFDAKLVEQYGMMRFANQAYERKPNEWKAAFRLGKGPTTAARKFAQDWLKALR